jgi:hypothetical protein
VRQFFAGFGASAEQKSHVALGFVAVLAVVAGFSLMYIGVTSKPPIPVKEIVSQIAIKNISGGNLPDALTGTAEEIKLTDPSKTPQPNFDFNAALQFEGNPEALLREATATETGLSGKTPGDPPREVAATETGLSSKTAVYGGLLTVVLGVLILGYLTLRKRQQQQ